MSTKDDIGRLKQYGVVYNRFVKEQKRAEKPKLNSYQLFVQKESKKNKYKNMRPSERLVIIAKLWEKQKS
jgi:hypothetical protein